MNWRFWTRAGHDDCAAIEPLLSLYSDDMVSQAERRRVEGHLSECPGCQQVLEWMQATRQVIARRPALAPPTDLRARIAHAIAEADAAKAPVQKAPARKAPARPAPRPLLRRPALAYGLSLAAFALIGGDIAWNAAHAPHAQVAVAPHVSPPVVSPITPAPAPRVASGGAAPQTPGVVRGAPAHPSQRPQLAANGADPARRLRVHPAPPTQVALVPQAVAPKRPVLSPQGPTRVAVTPHAPTLVPPHKSPNKPMTDARMAKVPATHLPKTITPLTQDNPQRVANVPPRDETPHTQAVITPPVVASVAHVAEHIGSTQEILSHAAMNLRTVAYTSKAVAVNAASVAITDNSSDRSLTANLVGTHLH